MQTRLVLALKDCLIHVHLMKVLDNVKEHGKILDLEVKCTNKGVFPSDHDGRGSADRKHIDSMCTWTGELRVYKVMCVVVYSR